MEDKAYYVPNITELHCGYICEIYKPDHPKLGAQGYWKQVKIGDLGQGTDIIPLTKFRNLKKENRIRTKYLDEEDIISLGFVKSGALRDGGTLVYHYDNRITLEGLHPNKNRIKISEIDSISIKLKVIFDGECKSINELNKILKLLKIK